MANVSPTGRSWNLPCLHISTETTSWLMKMPEWLLTSLFSWAPQDNFSASLLPDPYHSGWASAWLLRWMQWWHCSPMATASFKINRGMLEQQLSQTPRSYGKSHSWQEYQTISAQKFELATLTNALELRKDKRPRRPGCLCYCSFL